MKAIPVKSTEPEWYVGSRPTPFEGTMTFVKTFTDDGIIGIGGSNVYCSMGEIGLAKFIEAYKPILLGKDPVNIEKIWEDMWKARMVLLFSMPEAISAVEMSLWDIVGKSLGLPVYKLLGGVYREKVKTYVTLQGRWSPEEYAMKTREAMKLGFDTVKMELGWQHPKYDIEIIKTVREAVGNELDIAVDLNSAYSYLTALKVAREFEKYGVFFLEEPIEAPDIEGLVKLASTVDLPIAGGENVYGLLRFVKYIKEGAYDIIQQDTAKCGGILQAKKIAILAEAFGTPCIPHHNGLFSLYGNLHLAASCPNFPMIEGSSFPLMEAMSAFFKNPVTWKDGYMEVPDKPGLGIELNEEMIKKCEI